MLKMVIAHSIFILIAGLLTYMGFKYSREHPQHLRNYLISPNPVKVMSSGKDVLSKPLLDEDI
jgi:hypothetical protein